MSGKLLRTQILLTPELRKRIETQLKDKEESLSEYLRKAAFLRLEQEEKKRQNLRIIAQKLIGKLNLKKYPDWMSRDKILRWQRSLRQNR